jgi:hypothetical protein
LKQAPQDSSLADEWIGSEDRRWRIEARQYCPSSTPAALDFLRFPN